MSKDAVIDEKRNFDGIWIPSRLYQTGKFSPRTKFFIVEVKSLSKNGCCYAGDKHFADFLGISERMVQTIIKELKENGYLKADYVYDGQTKAIQKRYLTLTKKFYDEFYNEKGTEKNFSRGTEKNCGDKYNNIKDKYFINRLESVDNDFDNEILKKAKETTDNGMIITGIGYYLKKFKHQTGNPHPNITYKSLYMAIDSIETLLDNLDSIEDFESEQGLIRMIDNHFDTEYSESIDYKLQHFASSKVLEYQARTCRYITGWRD